MTAFDETLFLSSLHDRIAALERRIDSLDDGGKGERIKRRFRRKAKEISREFKVSFPINLVHPLRLLEILRIRDLIEKSSEAETWQEFRSNSKLISKLYKFSYIRFY